MGGFSLRRRGENDGFMYLGKGTFEVSHKGMAIVRLDVQGQWWLWWLERDW